MDKSTTKSKITLSGIFSGADSQGVQKLVGGSYLAIFLLSAVACFVYGGMLFHESSTESDTDTNYPLYFMSFLPNVLAVITAAVMSFRYGEGTLGGDVFWLSVVVCGIILVVTQAGVFNAIATPNLEGWNDVGYAAGVTILLLGGIFTFCFVALAVAKYKKPL